LEQYLNFHILKKDEMVAEVSLCKKTGQVTKNILSDYFLDVGQVEAITDATSLNDWFETRCMLRSRADADIILKLMGLKEFNPFHIVQKTQGAMFEDYYWVRFEGQEGLTWEGVDPRNK